MPKCHLYCLKRARSSKNIQKSNTVYCFSKKKRKNNLKPMDIVGLKFVQTEQKNQGSQSR